MIVRQLLDLHVFKGYFRFRTEETTLQELSISVLKLSGLREVVHPPHEETCEYAAQGGHLDCLKYLNKQLEVYILLLQLQL